MRTIFKALMCSLLLFSAINSFAKDVNVIKPSPLMLYAQAQKSPCSINATPTGYLIRQYLHYVGIQAGTGVYHYTMFITITENTSLNALYIPGAFTFYLDLTTGVPGQTFQWIIPANDYVSNTRDIYSDHALTTSDITGFTQSAYYFNGIPIGPDGAPIII